MADLSRSGSESSPWLGPGWAPVSAAGCNARMASATPTCPSTASCTAHLSRMDIPKDRVPDGPGEGGDDIGGVAR
ncbi:hypothetical protein Ddc_22500 [Ditylenchus destructor]|nr:hypothetical protein Ddc_22500 [Ditylenchus destructor]